MIEEPNASLTIAMVAMHHLDRIQSRDPDRNILI